MPDGPTWRREVFVPRIGCRRRRAEELVEAAEVKVTADYRTRSRSRYSTAARIWRASHAVQLSLCGNPGIPVVRPTATVCDYGFEKRIGSSASNGARRFYGGM